MRSIIYEYVLNVISILQIVELAFRLEYYDTNLAQANRWVLGQVVVNIFFLVTLILDWLILGLKQSYSRHPRVFAETLA